MKAIIQRVSSASVTVDKQIIGQINRGLLVYIAIHINDQESDIKKMADKILKLRIFADSNDKMNLSVADINLEILIVSQFTLYGDTSRGTRPSFTESAPADIAQNYYNKLITELKKSNLKIATGQFQAHMKVTSINDGPVTIILDI